MDRLVLIVGAGAVAGLMALIASRLRSRLRGEISPAPAHRVPERLDRDDFTRPGARWLVAVFTSEACSGCVRVWESAHRLEGLDVAVQRIEAEGEAALHARYRIDAVPLVVIADSTGVIRHSRAGPTNHVQLRAALRAALADR